jgi:hypothetical protein
MDTQTLVTFFLFSLEAYLHFIIGRGKVVIPGPGECVKIFGTVFVFSLLSTHIVGRLAANR